MSNKIQIRRSDLAVAPAAGSLAKGEMAWVDHGGSQGAGGSDGILYIGDMSSGTAVVRTIGGTLSSQYTLDLLTDTALTGNATATTQAPTDNSTRIATTEYVNDRINLSGGSFATLTDTDFTGQALANGHVAVWDNDDSEWQNQAMSGDVTMSKDGVMSVNSVQPGAIDLDTDASSPYVSDIQGTANEIEVASVSTGQGRAFTVGLPDDVTITGDLTVQGTTTRVESTVVSVADPVFVIGDDSSQNSQDRGIEFKYNKTPDAGNAKLGWFGYDATDDAFTYIPDATNTGEVFSGNVGNAIFADITGEMQTAVQPNVTTMSGLIEVGTITTGTWNGTFIASSHGGTGIDTSAATGVGIVTNGTWSTPAFLDQAQGGTGRTSTADGDLLIGAASGGMTVLAMGSVGQKLAVSASGTAEWSDTFDGGTF